MKAAVFILSGLMIFGGWVILLATAGWKIAAGAFLMLWGHYMESRIDGKWKKRGV